MYTERSKKPKHARVTEEDHQPGWRAPKVIHPALARAPVRPHGERVHQVGGSLDWAGHGASVKSVKHHRITWSTEAGGISMNAIVPETERAWTVGTAPGIFPFIGHGIALARRPLAFLNSLPAHGDLVELRLGPQRAWMVCHPELVHKVLMDPGPSTRGARCTTGWGS